MNSNPMQQDTNVTCISIFTLWSTVNTVGLYYQEQQLNGI